MIDRAEIPDAFSLLLDMDGGRYGYGTVLDVLYWTYYPTGQVNGCNGRENPVGRLLAEDIVTLQIVVGRVKAEKWTGCLRVSTHPKSLDSAISR